jgi:hypothetical protein
MTIESSSRSRSGYLWLAAILTVVIALRVVSLGADPMPELDWGFISDAGNWWKNPRLHAVWGVWTVDDGNFGILTAPAYTLVMRAVFALLGVGYAQAGVSSAVSGIVSVLLLFLITRREGGTAAGLLAAALMGINILTIAYDRSAYPESFQVMMMVAAVGAILASPGRPWLAALGGLAAAIVLLSKPPGIVLAPIATATWAAPWLMDRYGGGPRRFELRGLVAYLATAAILLAVVGVVYFLPNAQAVWRHIQTQMADGAAYGALATDRVLFFGSRLGYRLNGFFRYEWYLLAVTAAFGALRIARVFRRPVTTVEAASWLWLVMGIGIMGLQTYQQDRRFLFLIPPLSMLNALALSHAIELGESAWSSPRAKRIAAGAAAGVLALALLFYVVPIGVWKMISLGRLLGLTWSYGMAGGLLLSALALAVALVAAWRVPRIHWRGSVKLQMAAIVLPLLFALYRSGSEVLNRGRGLEKVSRTLDRISGGWPAAERVAVGWSSGTLTLESRVLAVNREIMGPPAAVRFRPQLELYTVNISGGVKRIPLWVVPGRPRKVDCAQLPIWNDASGRPRLMVHVFVEPDRVAPCQAAVRAPDTVSRRAQ